MSLLVPHLHERVETAGPALGPHLARVDVAQVLLQNGLHARRVLGPAQNRDHVLVVAFAGLRRLGVIRYLSAVPVPNDGSGGQVRVRGAALRDFL